MGNHGMFLILGKAGFTCRTSFLTSIDVLTWQICMQLRDLRCIQRLGYDVVNRTICVS